MIRGINCLTIILFVFLGYVGNSFALDLSDDLGEKPEGPITHTFSVKNGTITEGKCTQAGVWNWTGSKATYNGNVVADSDASGTHAGKFEGKYTTNSSGGGATPTWTASLTGSGGTHINKIASASITVQKITSTLAGAKADTSGHDGTNWLAVITGGQKTATINTPAVTSASWSSNQSVVRDRYTTTSYTLKLKVTCEIDGVTYKHDKATKSI